MKFNFRQGIQHAPLSVGHPSFLTYNPSNSTVTISIGVDLVRATAAYGDYNYLIEFESLVSLHRSRFHRQIVLGLSTPPT